MYSKITIGILLSLSAGCAEDSCFIAGTLVDTPTGKRRIEQLDIGDAILSWDSASGELVTRKIKTVMRDRVRTIVRIQTASATIEGVTPAHPFYVAQTAAYVPLRDLASDAALFVLSAPNTFREEVISLLSITESPTPTFEVFNLETDGPEHNYFANGILVHNKEPASPFCGDRFVEHPETCDDGNTTNGDGCSSLCRTEAGGAGGAASSGGSSSAGRAGSSGSPNQAGAGGNAGGD